MLSFEPRRVAKSNWLWEILRIQKPVQIAIMLRLQRLEELVRAQSWALGPGYCISRSWRFMFNA